MKREMVSSSEYQVEFLRDYDEFKREMEKVEGYSHSEIAMLYTAWRVARVEFQLGLLAQEGGAS